MSCVDFSARESRELTRIGKRRDWLLDFTKLWECDTSPCRLRWNQARAEKRCEDAPHSESISCEPCPSFAFIRVIRGQNLGCNVAQTSRSRRRGSQNLGCNVAQTSRSRRRGSQMVIF